jgi:DNA-binding MarR family transcriptional regulator
MQDVLADLPGYALRRASAAMLAEFSAALEPLDLRPTDASLLMLIEANPGITPGKLGTALGIQRANMVPLIARMEERGLITRKALDGRSFGLSMTDGGAELCVLVKQIVNAHEQSLIDRIPQAYQAHLLPALKSLWSA